jgi:hypothetical protein
MLLAYSVADSFVLSSLFPEPLNKAVLRYYLDKQKEVFVSYISRFDNRDIVELLTGRIAEIEATITNLKGFWTNMKLRENVFESVAFDFSGFFESSAINHYDRTQIATFQGIASRLRQTIGDLSDRFDPIQVLGQMTLNVSRVLFREDPIGLRIFRSSWENRELDKVLSEMFSNKAFGPHFSEIEQEILSESYRQVIIAASDLSRTLVGHLSQFFQKGKGNREPSFPDFIRIVDSVYSYLNIETIMYHLSIGIPMDIIGSDSLWVLIPNSKQLRNYPFQKELEIRNLRLQTHYVSSVDEQIAIPYSDLIEKRYYEDFRTLSEVLEKSSFYYILTYSSEEISEVIDNLAILDSQYNPFIKMGDNDGKVTYLTTPIIVHDALFRFVWTIRRKEHGKSIGTSFENFVKDYIISKLGDIPIKQHVFVYLPGPGEETRRFEIDLCFKYCSLLVCIDCKDYELLEDPDDFRSLAQRTGTLIEDCGYHKSKIDVLQHNFEEFLTRYPKFSESRFIYSLLVTQYPEIPTMSEGISVMTVFELVRLLRELEKQDLMELSDGSEHTFLDIGEVDLQYRIINLAKE